MLPKSASLLLAAAMAAALAGLGSAEALAQAPKTIRIIADEQVPGAALSRRAARTNRDLKRRMTMLRDLTTRSKRAAQQFGR